VAPDQWITHRSFRWWVAHRYMASPGRPGPARAGAGWRGGRGSPRDLPPWSRSLFYDNGRKLTVITSPRAGSLTRW